MVADERLEVRAADLLLALEDDADVDRQRPGLPEVRLERLDVHEQLPLVVGGAAREQLVVAHRRLERRRRPQLERVDRLHVVVPVEEHRRRAGRVQPVAVDDRVARRVDHPHVLEADGPQVIGGPVGAAAHVAGVLGQRADARDGEVLGEFLEVPVAARVDEVDDGGIHGLLLFVARGLPPAAAYTPQVPPKPIVTLSPSTITGTSRRPFEKASMRSSAARSFFTSTYSNSARRLAWSSRAARVYGHVSFPKM